MRIPDPKANTTTEAYLAYKAGFLEAGELKPSLYEPNLHFDAWLAYWAGLTDTYPISEVGKNIYIGSQDFSGDWKNLNSWNTEEEKYNGLVVKSKSAAWNGLYKPFAVKAGETYTFSVYAKATTARNASLYLRPLSGDIAETTPQNKVLSLTTEWQRYSVTFEVNGAGFVCPRLENTSNQETPTYVCGYQLEKGSTATAYEPYTGEPEMLCDEEALVAYLSGVTDTYPEEIKDPYDVRIVGYLKYLVSARFGRPEYPVNNQEFYLSTMKPPVVPSGDTPAINIELDGTAEAPFIDLKMFGDTKQNSYTGKNLLKLFGRTASGVTGTVNADGSYTISGTGTVTDGVSVFGFNGVLPAGTYTLSLSKALPEVINLSLESGVALRIPAGSTSATVTTTKEYTSASVFFGIKNGVSYDETFNMQLVAGETPDYDFEPYVGGMPSPNPDYPQPISVVTGRQEVDVIGDGTNLFDAFNENSGNIVVLEDGTMEVSGISSSNGYCSLNRKLSQLIPSVKVGDVVYLYLETDFSARQYVYSDGDKTNWYSGQSRTVTQEMLDKGFVVYGGYQTTNHIRVMMSKSQASEYVPYLGEPYEINLGKNLVGLVDKAETTENGLTYSIEDGIVTVDGTATATTYLEITDMFSLGGAPSDFVLSLTPISGEVSYCIIGLSSRNANDGQVQWHQVNTDLVPSVKEYSSSVLSSIKTIKPYINKNSSFNNFKFKLQLERGSEATSYASYFKPIELCKITYNSGASVLQDYIYKDEDSWFMHNATAKRVLNGSEDWVLSSITQGYTRAHLMGIGSPTQIGFCDKLTTRVGSHGEYEYVWFQPSENGGLYVQVKTERLSGDTLDAFKAWLRENPVKVVYGLRAPTETQITNPALIAQLDALVEGGSYEGKTYIEITATDPNLPAGLIVEAAKYA